MAVMARNVGGSSGLKVAVVVFVVLTVASLTGTMVMYTYLDDQILAANEASERAARSEQRVREIENQMRSFARQVIGQEVEDLARIDDALRSGTRPVIEDPAMQAAHLAENAPVLDALKTLHGLFQAQQQALQQVTAERDQLRGEVAEMKRQADRSRQEFADKTADLERRFASLEQQTSENRAAWERQVSELAAQLERASEAASQQLGSERQQRQALEKELAEARARTSELVRTLASFRPRADQTAPLRIADGQIIRAVPGERIVYVSLGREDNIQRGMTFSVYSKTREIPEDGKGKATIEITEVFDRTAEARVTASTRGDPILEGDLIANPVYDRNRRYNFVVAGDFDLNFDGTPEDTGGEQVKALIRQAGGQVMDRLDTRTDFVVLGAPPAVTTTENLNASPQIQELLRQQQARRQTFDDIAREARSLSIPVLTRTQFLQYLGMTVPAGASGTMDHLGS